MVKNIFLFFVAMYFIDYADVGWLVILVMFLWLGGLRRETHN